MYDKPVRERTVVITLVSPLLFFVPEVYLRDLERLWTDQILIETVWKSFMAKLLGEWQDVVLWVSQTRFFQNLFPFTHVTHQSAVMLVANVGFLAIPGVVITNLSGAAITSPSQLIISTSPAQIASYLSIQTSVGSIVTSLLLLRHNRTKQKEDPSGAVSPYSHFTYVPK